MVSRVLFQSLKISHILQKNARLNPKKSLSAHYSSRIITHQINDSIVKDGTNPEQLTNKFSPETQPEEPRIVLDVIQSLTSNANDGVKTVYDSTPDPKKFSMKENDNPHHPSGWQDTLKAINGSDYVNNTLVRDYYKDIPQSMDADYAPATLPSGYKDPESGVIYYNTTDKFLNTIPIKGLEDKFVDPDDLPPIEVTSSIVRCDGVNEVTPDLRVLPTAAIDKRLGHPNVYIKLERLYEQKRCPYCGVHYKKVPTHKHHPKPYNIESMPDEKDDWYVEEIKRVKGRRVPHH